MTANVGNFSFSFGGGTDAKDTYWLMNRQSDLWRNDTQWFNENGWSQLRQGLINADYNPILALGTSPMSAPTMSATANKPIVSGSIDSASGIQANVAKDMSKSQIMVNKATANKTAEEALTQQNVRNNLNSQALLNFVTSDRVRKLLPYDIQKAIVDVAVGNSVVNANNATARLNNVNADYVPYEQHSKRISSVADSINAKNGSWSRLTGSIFDQLVDSLGIYLGDKESKEKSQSRQDFRYGY